MPHTPAPVLLADSITPSGDRITTFKLTMWRPMAAEFNTHRSLDRNAASTRAIPTRKRLNQVIADNFTPERWASEQPGMQGGNELTGWDLSRAQSLWSALRSANTHLIRTYLDDIEHRYPGLDDDELRRHTLHKSVLCRPLESFLYHDVIATGTEWANFFLQRSSRFTDQAQPEFSAFADQMLDLYDASTPRTLEWGEWHLPYADDDDTTNWCHDNATSRFSPSVLACFVSAGRCCRVSYNNHDGDRDPADHVNLALRLLRARPMHASPFGHQAQAKETLFSHETSNLTGYRQFRKALQTIIPDAYLPAHWTTDGFDYTTSYAAELAS